MEETASQTLAARVDQTPLAFVAEYRSAFETLDPEAIAAFYATPFLGVNDEKSIVWLQHSDVIDNFVEVTNGLRALGFTRTEYRVREVRELSRTLLQIPVCWRLLDADGRQVGSINVLYTVKRGPSSWQIVAVFGIEDQASA